MILEKQNYSSPLWIQFIYKNTILALLITQKPEKTPTQTFGCDSAKHCMGDKISSVENTVQEWGIPSFLPGLPTCLFPLLLAK